MLSFPWSFLQEMTELIFLVKTLSQDGRLHFMLGWYKYGILSKTNLVNYKRQLVIFSKENTQVSLYLSFIYNDYIPLP